MASHAATVTGSKLRSASDIGGGRLGVSVPSLHGHDGAHHPPDSIAAERRKRSKVSDLTFNLAETGFATRPRNPGIAGSRHQLEVCVPQVVPSSEIRPFGRRQRLPTPTDRQMPVPNATGNDPIRSQSAASWRQLSAIFIRWGDGYPRRIVHHVCSDTEQA